MTIDVSEIVLDPDFAEFITVITRTDTVGTNGRTSQIETQVPNVAAVVVPAGPNDLDRLDDSQRQNRIMQVITSYKLQGPRTGKQPDLIVWRGDRYIVATSDPWMQGNGFVRALVHSIDSIEAPL